MKKTNRTFPKKRIPLIVLMLLTVSLLCTSCQQGTKSLYLRSSRAGGSGEKSNVVDITIPHQSVQVTDPNTVTVTIGLGGDMKISAHENQTAVLEIDAEGCLINGVADLFEKEYHDYFTNTDLRATVEESYWGYPTKTPNYFEDIEITLPTGECRGQIDVTLYIKEDLYEGYTAEVTVYYASNGNVIWFSERALSEVDQKDRPVSVDQKR
jgi:hypothetical protein